MADIGTAYVRVAPNMTGIQGKIAAGFRGAGAQAGASLQAGISTKTAAIAGAVAGIAASAVNRAMNLVGNSIGDAISRVDTLARFPTVMKNLGYSAEGAAQQVNRIAKELIGLPTSLDSLVTFVQRVAPVSSSLKEATDLALAFNNAVLAGGGPTYRQADAIEQFSQMLAKGKPDMMAWRTLQEAMPATLGQIAKQLGITSGNTLDLYDALMDGKIGFDDFTDAVIKLNSKGLPGFKNFEDQAKDATAGIATGIQNAQTAITRGLAKIMQTVGQKNISNAIADIGAAFETVLTKIATILPPVLKTLGDFVGFVARNKDVFLSVAVGIGAAVVALKTYNTVMAVSKALTAAYTAVSAYLTLVASLQAQGLGVLKAAWIGLNIVMRANPIGLVITAVAALVAGLVFFFTRTETGKKIFASFASFFGKVWEGIKAVIKSVGDFFQRNFDIIKKVLLGFAAVILLPFLPFIALTVLIVKNFTTIKNVIMTVLTSIWNFIKPILNFIKNLFIIVFGSIALIVLTYLTAVKKVVTTVFNALWAVIRTVLGAIRTVVMLYFNIYKTIITTVFNAVASFVSSVWNRIYSIISGVVKRLIAFFAPAFNWLYSKGRAIVSGLASGISSAAGAVWNAIKSVSDRIGRFFAGAGRWLYDVGKSIVQGLVNGIKSMVGSVNNAAGEIGNSVKNKVKGLLGIHSPSTVFTEIGVNIGEGMAKGIAATAGMVSKSAGAMTSAALQDVTGPVVDPSVAFRGAAGVSPSGGGNRTTNQTVTIGTVVLANKEAAKEMFDRLNQDTINLSMGLTPLQGAQ